MRFLLAFCACAMALSAHAAAQTLTWTGNGNGTSFNLATNWSPVALPGSGNDCVIPAGGPTIVIGNNTAVKSITSARNLYVEGCVTLTMSGDLALSGGATVQIDNTGGCTGLVFSGGPAAISGSGGIFISSEGTNGKAISVTGGASLSIDAGIAISFGPGATGNGAQISVDAGSAIIHSGTIAAKQAAQTLSIGGAGSFTNLGTLKAEAGTLSLAAGSWVNSGGVQVSAGAIASFGGTFASLGPIANSGGAVKVISAANSSLTASAATGPITLAAATLTGCTLLATDGMSFATDGACTLSGCTVGANLALGSCSKILVTNSLTLANNAVVSIGDTCTGPPLEFRSGNQFIHGAGTIQLRKDDSNDDRALRLTTQVTLTIDAGITVASTIGTGTQSLAVDGGCTLINKGTITTQSGTFRIDASASGTTLTNNGTISATGGSFTLDCSGPSGQFSSSGTLAFSNAAVAEIKGGTWTNTGAITVDGAKLTVSDNWTNSGPINCTNATISFGGAAWTNSGNVSLTSSTTQIYAAAWSNAGTFGVNGGSAQLQGAWTNAGAMNLLNAGTILSGTYASLEGISRSGGTLSVGGVYTGAVLAATAQTGDLIVAAAMNGTTLVNQGATLIPSGLALTNCTIASDLLLGASRTMTVLGTLTLANNAVVTLGTDQTGGNSGGLILSGGSPIISGAGTLRVLQATTLFTFNSASNLTLGPGIVLTVGPGAKTNTEARATIPTGSSITNQGTFRVAQTGCSVLILGPGLFKNQGVLDAASGTLDIRAMSGLLGSINIASGAAISLQGAYTIDQPVDCRGSLTLAGTWTNNSTVSVTGGFLSLGGTWTNAGTFAVQSSTWVIGGTFPAMGAFTVANSPRIIAGKYPETLLIADAQTGDVIFNAATFTNARLEAHDGAVFRMSNGGAWAILDGCTLAGDLLATSCVVLQIEHGLTMEDALISLDSAAGCGPAILTVPYTSQTIAGTGEIAIRNTDGVSSALQVQNGANLTIDSGITLVCPPDGRGGAKVFFGSDATTFTNRGRIKMQTAGKTFWFSGGTFVNNGTLESTAGQLFIDAATIQNFNTSNGTLTGGKWLGNGGGLSLGARNIRTIAPETEVALLSAAGTSAPNLSMLTSNQGTLRIANRSVGMTPVGGTFTNSGLIEMTPDVVFAVTGALTLQAGGTVRTAIKGTTTAQFGRMQATGAAVLAGHLRGSFVSPYAPAAGVYYTPVIAGSHVTGAFSDICFDDNPQNMGVVPSLLSTQLRLQSSLASGIAPEITSQPASTTAAPSATFTVAAAPTSNTFRWKRDGVSLTNGPTPGGSIISGSTAATLTIQNAGPEDVGAYTVTVSNACGEVASNPAQLSICTGDLNHDGLVDDADFEHFVAAYNTLDCADPLMPASCPADFNRDGLVDDTDFQLFVPAYDELVCP